MSESIRGFERSLKRTVTRVAISQGATTTQLAAAVSGKRNSIVGGTLVMDAPGTVKFIDGSGDLTGAMAFAANGGVSFSADIVPTIATSLNSALSIVSTAGVKGWVVIITEAD